MTGTALTYNQEATLGTAAFYAVGRVWAEDTPTFTQKTSVLRIMGGDADVDSFLQQTYNNMNDLEAAVIAAKAKATGRKFSDSFFNGDNAVDANAFDGLHKLIPAAQRRKANGDNVNGGALTLDDLDVAIDLVKPGKPDALFMSKRTRRKLKGLRRAQANVMDVGLDQFGRRVEYYDGIPIYADDFILDTRTVGTSTNTSTLYAVQFGFQRGVMGLDNGGVQVERIGALETKDAQRTRIKWYTSLAMFRDISCSLVEGITNA